MFVDPVCSGMTLFVCLLIMFFKKRCLCLLIMFVLG